MSVGTVQPSTMVPTRNPLPPGQDGLPPPGHRFGHGDYDGQGDYDGPEVPDWAPPPPPPPPWAPWVPVVSNADAQVWGVWMGAAFIAL